MSPILKNASPSSASTPAKSAESSRISDAGEQFEALLMGQILRSARESNGGSNDCATEFAEQHLATVLAQHGGLGLARLIGQGLGAQKLQA